MTRTTKIFRHTNSESIVAHCLIFTTNEEYETKLCKTHHKFYAFNHESLKKWDTEEYKIPDNYTILKQNEMPTWMDFDAIIVQHKQSQYQIASNIRNALKIPMIVVEHSKPSESSSLEQEVLTLKNMVGDVNIFPSEENAKLWGIDNKTFVITESDNAQFEAQWELILEQLCEV